MHALVPVPEGVGAAIPFVQPGDVDAVASEVFEVEEGARVAGVEHRLAGMRKNITGCQIVHSQSENCLLGVA